jgi:hypothetical protein
MNVGETLITDTDTIEGMSLSSRKTVSALNGRIGSDILIPPYQRIVETEYLLPSTSHWTEECWPIEANEIVEEDFPEEKILQARKLSLRVF